MSTVVWIVAGVGFSLLGYVGWTYNRLVSLGKRADGAWSDVDVQLKRRWDLVPMLVESVKGYAGHESGTLQAVVEARSKATAAQQAPIAARGESERGLASAVGGLFAVAEAYPDLKASAGFRDLQKTLTDLEDQIQYARRYYNAVVRDLNTLIESFPPMFVARALGFRPREPFQLDAPSERSAPQVRFGSGGG